MSPLPCLLRPCITYKVGKWPQSPGAWHHCMAPIVGLSNNASWIIHLPPHIWPSLDSEVAIICWQDPTPPGPVCNNLTVHYYTARIHLFPQLFTNNLPSEQMIGWSYTTSLLFLADSSNIYIYIVTPLIGTLPSLSRNYSLLSAPKIQ